MKQHLVEIKGSTLFDEYLQSMGVPSTALDREQDIYLQERHLGAIAGGKASCAFICVPMP